MNPIEINGVAHTFLTVNDFEKSRLFYGGLMTFFGLERVFDGSDFVYWVGGRTALGIRPAEAAHRDLAFDQYRVGLHHICFRARERADVDLVAAYLERAQAAIVRGPMEGGWAPGYYYVLFEDPDGIRLEICHVPGKGVLKDETVFDPGADFTPRA